MKRRLQISGLLFLLLLAGGLAALRPTGRQSAVVEAARGCLGDVYDSASYPGGAPPEGRGACTDVVWRAYSPVLNIQEEMDRDVLDHPDVYPGERNRDLDFRWCPKLMLWASRRGESLATEINWLTVWTFRPGDIVFYDTGDGVPGHVGVVSDRWSLTGQPLLIHNFGPVCVEENALNLGKILGHYRLLD